MSLIKDSKQRLKNSSLHLDTRALIACREAKEFEEAGNYEAGREALHEFWPSGTEERPRTNGLPPETSAEMLLRTGVLTSLLGSSRQFGGPQESAKNLISESIRAFESLGLPERAQEAHVELAVCYWREGAIDEARVILGGVLEELGEDGGELKAIALLRSAIVERSATRFNDALLILTRAAPLFEESSNHTLKGKFHGQLAVVLKNLGEAEQRADYTDRALLEYTAAGYHFEQAGHLRYSARVENNLGFLYSVNGKFPEAHEHLDRARQQFASLYDSGGVAYVDETRARAFLAEGRFAEAERSARAAVKTHERGDEQSMLAGALIVHGTALARLGQDTTAHVALRRGVEVAEQAGDIEGAGVATLTVIEELHEHFPNEELLCYYLKADELLARTQSLDALKRLRACARIVLDSRLWISPSSDETEIIPSDFGTGEPSRQTWSVLDSQVMATDSGANGAGRETLTRLRESVEADAPTTLIPAGFWENFSLREATHNFERRFIELALLYANGKVSHASRLLGFRHHESLNSLLKNRHCDLLHARKPVKPRRRSIIRRHD
ncbi:MAG: hypothetical protein WCD76_12020 [Pyrinomonadaceae bacterium]